MGRLPRAVDGLIYHALNRGNNRDDVFTDDGDREAWGDSGDTIANPLEMSMVSLELPALARPPATDRGVDMPVRRDHNYGHNGTPAAILPDL
jgi:hypothetical protein